MYRLLLLSLLALLVPSTAVATINSGGEKFSPKKGLDLNQSFEGQRAAIAKALADGETYSEIAAEDLLTVRNSLEHISRLLDGAQRVDQLRPEVKVRVFNEQERVNNLLSRAHADSRMICRRQMATGSNMRTNICMTVAQRRKARDSAVDFMQFNPRAQAKPVNP